MAFLIGCGLDASQVRPAPSPPIRQIDHILIRTGNPPELYTFLTDTLQLPVAWPLSSPREGVMTGGVGVGNVNLEAIRFPGQTEERPRLLGFALEPSSLDESARQLTLRGLGLGPRREIVGGRPDGSRGTLWTNVTLPQFSDSDNSADGTVQIFLSEYHPAYVDVAQRRATLRAQLASIGGGPLGVVDVKEVVVGVSDLDAARRRWQQLLDPVPSAGPDTWQVGDGPAVRLVRASRNGMEAVVIRVASLDRAKTFLRDRQLLGAETDGPVTLVSPSVRGAFLRLVER